MEKYKLNRSIIYDFITATDKVKEAMKGLESSKKSCDSFYKQGLLIKYLVKAM